MKGMKNMGEMIKGIKQLVEKNQLEAAINEMIRFGKRNELEEFISLYIWPQELLQELIIKESKGEFMHWDNVYDLVANLKTLQAAWFYRDESGAFYNVNQVNLKETVQRLEQSYQCI